MKLKFRQKNYVGLKVGGFLGTVLVVKAWKDVWSLKKAKVSGGGETGVEALSYEFQG